MIYFGSTPEVLARATLAARGGQAVSVLEPSARLGGWAAAEELWPQVFVPLQCHHAGGLSQRLIDRLRLVQDHGLAFLDPPALAHAPAAVEGGASLTIWRQMDRTSEEIRRHSPEDAERWPDFCRQMHGHGALLDQLLQLDLAALLRQGLDTFGPSGTGSVEPDQPAPAGNETALAEALPRLSKLLLSRSTRSEAAPLLRFAARLRGQGGPEMMEFLRVLPMTFKELMDEWFESPLLRGLLGTSAVLNSHLGPQAAGTTLNFLYHLIGSPDGQFRSVRRVRGGLPALMDALESCTRSAGVDITLNADIGAHLASAETDGGAGTSSNGWVSAYTPHWTHLHMLPSTQVTPSLLRRLRPHAGRPVTTYLHLLLKDAASPPDAETGHIVVAPSLDYLERASDAVKYARPSQHLVVDAFRTHDQVLTLRLQFTYPDQQPSDLTSMALQAFPLDPSLVQSTALRPSNPIYSGQSLDLDQLIQRAF